MQIVTTLQYICGLALAVFLVTNTIHLSAFAKPEVSISPSCGPKSGLNVMIKANGFIADSIVSWNLVDSDGNVPVTGYFHADSNGEINDQTSLDEVKEGDYKIYFGDDTNIDGKLDSEIDHSDIAIPCQNK
jgi:hypothetical protein